MPTSYTSLLGLALPVTGELSGTWGDTVNDYITKYLDAAVAGAQTISGSQTAVTLSVTTATNLTQVGSGATGSAQYQIINCTGNPASLLTITAPAASKVYLVLNSTSTSQSVKVVGAGPTTGVTMVSGERALIAWNGSDFVKVATTVLGAGGSNTQVQFNSSGVLAGSANLTFDGTNLTLGGGTANGVAFLNGSKVLTTGSALTYNGTALQLNAASFPALKFGDNLAALKGEIYYGIAGNDLNIVNYTNGPIVFQTNSAEQMRLTSVGLGIGTSSPQYVVDAFSANNGVVQVRGGSATNQGGAFFVRNAANSFTFAAMGDRARIFGGTPDQTASIFTSNAPLAFDIAGSTKATITPAGNLLVGTTVDAAKLHVSTGTTTNAIAGNAVAGFTSGSNAVLSLNVPDANAAGLFFGYGGNPYWAGIEKTGSTGLSLVSGGIIKFDAVGTERARITSGGYFKASNTGTDQGIAGLSGQYAGGLNHAFFADAANDYTVVSGASNTNGAVAYGSFLNSGSTGDHYRGVLNSLAVYRVLANGNVQNQNNSYGAISDLKLKENVTDATPKLANLNRLRVVNYNLIGSELKQIGLIAQEVEQVFPGLVESTPDTAEVEVIDEATGETRTERQPTGTVTKAVKYSVLVPMLLKAVQELTEQNATLAARVAALETKGTQP